MLTLTKAVVLRLLQLAEAEPDVEVTGFVANGPQGQRVQPMRNVAHYPDRYYDWDPAEMLEQYMRMDENQEGPICIYHSHPGGKPDPSETDMQGALNIGMHYGILYPDTSAGLWRLSVWECIELGILVSSEYEVAP